MTSGGSAVVIPCKRIISVAVRQIERRAILIIRHVEAWQ
jgi:hypothetical protein